MAKENAPKKVYQKAPFVSRRKIKRASQSNAGSGFQRRRRRVSFELLISFLVSHLQGLEKKMISERNAVIHCRILKVHVKIS